MSDAAGLQAYAYRDATAYPVCVPPDLPTVGRIGVFDNSGAVVPSTADDRHQGSHTFVPAVPSDYPTPTMRYGEAIYAGAYYERFGHFLLEGLQRLWWAKDRPDLPIVWAAPDHWTTVRPLRQWQRDLLSIIGIRNEIIILTAPAHFDLLHVPDAGYKYADWCHPRQAEFLACYEGPPQIPGRKLWLSRSGNHAVGVINSEIIERRLRPEGWRIIHPERLPMREQLDELAQAEIIAGEEGSAFHTLLLLRDVSQKELKVFRRRGPEHLSFTTIGNARHLNQGFYSASHDAVISTAGRVVARLSPNPAQYLSHLGVRIPPPSDSVPDHTVRRINRLASATGAETYLQLGWFNHASFDGIQVPHRDFVDENFSFDVRSYRDRGAHFYEVTLERFFQWFADGRRYDIIMIDSAHRWRDVLQQLEAVLSEATHQRTVIVIDNVVPVDRFSALPDHGDALRQRRAAGSNRKSWHGDVYKAVFALHDHFPDLSYATIATGGNPQTVVWRRSREIHPRFGGEEQIDALGYEAVAEHRTAFEYASEDAVISRIASIAGKPDMTRASGLGQLNAVVRSRLFRRP
jgi:hypothetical protein